MWELDMFLRSMLINFACKLTNKSRFQISLMTDDQILKLVEEKFSQLSEDEKQGIIDAVIGPLLYSIFPRRIPIPKDEGMSDYMTLIDQEDHLYQQSSTILDDILFFFFYLDIIVVGVLFLIRIKEYVLKTDPPPPKWKKLKFPKRSIFPKGLKSVTEPYIREIHIVFRQDVPTEGNRASEREI